MLFVDFVSVKSVLIYAEFINNCVQKRRNKANLNPLFISAEHIEIFGKILVDFYFFGFLFTLSWNSCCLNSFHSVEAVGAEFLFLIKGNEIIIIVVDKKAVGINKIKSAISSFLLVAEVADVIIKILGILKEEKNLLLKH